MADRTESTVVVAASATRVLDVVADFDAYPQWAKEVTQVRVLATEGDGWPDRVEFTLDAGVLRDTYTLDYTWDVAQDGTGTVSWTLVKASILRSMDGSYTLAASTLPDGTPGTAVTYRLAVDLTIPMLGMLKRRAERTIVDTALTGLRQRAEGAR